jgi:hypothetical protein
MCVIVRTALCPVTTAPVAGETFGWKSAPPAEGKGTCVPRRPSFRIVG